MVHPNWFAVVCLVLVFYGAYRILTKAGYSGWWSLMLLVPGVNLILDLVFATSDWPALRRQTNQPDAA